MASIRKRGKAQWEARIRKKGWPVTCKTFSTRVLAEQWAKQIESEMERGAFTSRTEAETTPLYEALARYIDEYVPQLADARRQTNRAKALQRRLLSKRFLASIRGKDIADFIKERQEDGVGANTVRLDLALLSRVFEIAGSNWGMESLANPVKRVNKPKLSHGRTRRLEGNEEIRLLKASPSPFKEVIPIRPRNIHAPRRDRIYGVVSNRFQSQRSSPL